MIVRIRRDFVRNRDHHEFAQCQRRRQFIDGWKALMPMGGRVELRAELVGGERVCRDLETGLFVRSCAESCAGRLIGLSFVHSLRAFLIA
jgi:hypothetical protein